MPVSQPARRTSRRAVIAAVAFAAAWPPCRSANAASSAFDGTWAGEFGGGDRRGFQIIVAGDTVIGLFAFGDYVSDFSAKITSALMSIDFGQPPRNLTLKPDGARNLRGVYRDEQGRTRDIRLTKD